MVTTDKTKTVNRKYLLQWQVRNMLCRTTVIGEDYLEKIDKGLTNQWFRAVKVHGFDATNRCHAGLECVINWLTHSIEVVVWGAEARINETVWAEDCAPELINAVTIFNQAANAQCLTTKWRAFCEPGVDVEMVCRELGLVPAPAITWAGKVSQQASQVAELPELTVRLLFAESDELAPPPANPAKPEDGSQAKPGEKPSPESLFERIKQVLER
jgi:hypothetical protein